MSARWAYPAALAVCAALLLPAAAIARQARMISSQPQAEAILSGDHAEYVVRFDAPVDHYASRMEIVQGGQVLHTLRPLQDSAVDVLFSAGPVPKAGRYGLRWTAVTSGGESSSGEIPFSVK